MIENKEVMAKNIQRLMDYNHVKAVDVCNAIDCKANTFSDWIHAKSYPRIDKIEKMAQYFNVSKAAMCLFYGISSNLLVTLVSSKKGAARHYPKTALYKGR